MIRIQNIYHMLAYAFQVLCEQGYREMATEESTTRRSSALLF